MRDLGELYPDALSDRGEVVGTRWVNAPGTRSCGRTGSWPRPLTATAAIHPSFRFLPSCHSIQPTPGSFQTTCPRSFSRRPGQRSMCVRPIRRRVVEQQQTGILIRSSAYAYGDALRGRGGPEEAIVVRLRWRRGLLRNATAARGTVFAATTCPRPASEGSRPPSVVLRRADRRAPGCGTPPERRGCALPRSQGSSCARLWSSP